MDFFDTLSETVASAGKVFSHKTKEVAGSTKLSFQISQEEAKLKKAYAALGQAYYEVSADDMPEQYAVYAADIKECIDRMEALTKDKQILKNQKRCVKCGAVMPNEDRFCGKCGAENEVLVKEEPEVQEEATKADAGDETKICPNCQAEVNAELLYCPECGERFQ